MSNTTYTLPVSFTDTLYRKGAEGFWWRLGHVEIYPDEIVFYDDSDNAFRAEDIGKTIFLTPEEAEVADER